MAGNYRKWSPQELEFLTENYSNLEISEIAIQLNRTETAVMGKANTLGLYRGRNWSEEDIEYLYEKFGNVSIDSMAKHLGRSRMAVVQKAQKLGLGNFLDNGDRYINKHKLMLALGLTGGDSYKNTSWIQNRGLPTHRLKRLNQTFDVIYIDEFWKWAEENQSFLDFSKFEKYNLGPEPEWVDKKRRQDYMRSRSFKVVPWTKDEDSRLHHYLKEHKYTYMELSKKLNRTTGAIQRRICDLGYKERPIKANNHNKWSDDEWSTLANMIKEGCYSYEDMSDVIGRSSKAIRGRVFDMYLTENLDKVRAYIGSGNWGDGRPDIPLKYKRLMSADDKEKVNDLLSLISFQLLQIAKSNSNVADEFKDFFQKDMCANWDDIEGCLAGSKSCDTCIHFKRIEPQYCVRCGKTFYERKSNKICASCRRARIKQAQRKFAIMINRRKVI